MINPIVKTIELPDGRTITLETGKLAKQADGSVMLRMGKHRVVVIAVGIFFLQFHADVVDMGIFRRHFRRLLFQTPSFTLKDQFIVPLAQFAHTVYDLITGVIVQIGRASCRERV